MINFIIARVYLWMHLVTGWRKNGLYCQATAPRSNTVQEKHSRLDKTNKHKQVKEPWIKLFDHSECGNVTLHFVSSLCNCANIIPLDKLYTLAYAKWKPSPVLSHMNTSVRILNPHLRKKPKCVDVDLFQNVIVSYCRYKSIRLLGNGFNYV